MKKLERIGTFSHQRFRTSWWWWYALARLWRVENRFRQVSASDFDPYLTDLHGLVSRELAVSSNEVENLIIELESERARFSDYLAKDGTSDMQLIELLYIMVRTQSPKLVVETGIWHGVSSLAILLAFERNSSGRLLSVDLPPVRRKVRVPIGGAVPGHLLHRWEVYVGPSRKVLSELDVGSDLDLFLHDSDHSYRSMKGEFEFAWAHLRPGGLLVSDDILLNGAFLEFAQDRSVVPWVTARSKGGFLGILRKPEVTPS